MFVEADDELPGLSIFYHRIDIFTEFAPVQARQQWGGCVCPPKPRSNGGRISRVMERIPVADAILMLVATDDTSETPVVSKTESKTSQRYYLPSGLVEWSNLENLERS